MVTAVCQEDPASGCHELPQGLTHPTPLESRAWGIDCRVYSRSKRVYNVVLVW